MPRVFFEIYHPKHLHQFVSIAERANGLFESIFLIKDKDNTIALAEAMNVEYQRIGQFGRTLWEKLRNSVSIISELESKQQEYRPGLIVSRSSPYSTLLARLRPIRSLIMPDSEVVPLINYFVAPLADVVVTPDHYGRNHKRHIRVPGVFEECYLHPTTFRLDPTVLEHVGVGADDRFSFVRFVGWNANHDVGQKGLGPMEKRSIIKALEGHGQVFLSSEADIPADLEKYRIRIPPHLAQSLLAYASVYVGDSQSMATEAALLGTPSIRYNSFVGEHDMSNFRMLEERYGLVRNASTFESARNLAVTALEEDWKRSWIEKRTQYFSNRRPLAEVLASVVANCAITRS